MDEEGGTSAEDEDNMEDMKMDILIKKIHDVPDKEYLSYPDIARILYPNWDKQAQIAFYQSRSAAFKVGTLTDDTLYSTILNLLKVLILL